MPDLEKALGSCSGYGLISHLLKPIVINGQGRLG